MHLGFAEDKPQRVADIFEGVMAPPCPIDGKPVVFSTHIHANTYLFWLSFVAADNLVSELTYKFDMLRQFINIGETNHSKGSSGNKGESRSKSLINLHIPRASSRFAKDSGNHTTDCYGTNPLEPMPSVFIYGSDVKDQSKMKLRPG